MADLFGKFNENVIDRVNSDNELADQFEGDFFNGATSDFLGIAIGKKARARKKARRDDRQAARKYKMETERIRALQGKPKESIVKDIASGLTNVASAVFGGGAAQSQAEPIYNEQLPNNTQPLPRDTPQEKNNTVIYVVVVLVVVAAVYFIIKRK